jgi:hypothetical protein
MTLVTFFVHTTVLKQYLLHTKLPIVIFAIAHGTKLRPKYNNDKMTKTQCCIDKLQKRGSTTNCTYTYAPTASQLQQIILSAILSVW